MMLPFSSKIEISADKKTKSIFQSLKVDNMYYPDNPTNTKISYDKKIIISIEANEVTHLRANLNSILRLVQASNDSIESVKK